jgi:hypothetical protein
MVKKEPDLTSRYLGAVVRMLDALDRPRFATFWETPPRPGEWHGRSSLLQSFLFLYALLHARGRGERHFERARSLPVWPLNCCVPN